MSTHDDNAAAKPPLACRAVPDAAMRVWMDALGLTPEDVAEDDEALAGACRDGDLPRAWALLELGADADAGEDYSSPLYWAASDADHVALVELLLTYGADAAGGRGEFNGTLLHETPSAAMVRTLVAAGCDVNAADDDGHTPLHEAVSAGAARALLAAGADPAARNDKGETPLHRHPELASVLLAHVAAAKSGSGSVDAALALLEARDDEGRTPLLCAARLTSVRELLHDHGRLCAHSDWTAVDARGRTALHLLAAVRVSNGCDGLEQHHALLGGLSGLLAGERRCVFADREAAEPAVIRAVCEVPAVEPRKK